MVSPSFFPRLGGETPSAMMALSSAPLHWNISGTTSRPWPKVLCPTEVLAAIDDASLKAQPKWPPYFFGNEVFGSERREARLSS